MSLQTAAVWLWTICIAVNLTSFTLLTRRLRRFHGAAWEQLGRPTFLANSPRAARIGMRVFLRRREYLSLADKRLIVLASSVRASGWLCWIFLVLMVLVYL
jgi:hypothetical protein